MKTYYKIGLLMAFLFLSFNSLGQAVGRRISETTLGIYNNSDRPLGFELGPSRKTVKPYQIAAQENWISPTYPAQVKPVFRIRTAQNVAKYTLKLNRKYMLSWNSQKQRWDLTQVNSE